MKYFSFTLRYYFSWLLLFVGMKLAFLFYHAENIDLYAFASALWHGLELDLSMSAYFTFVILILQIIQLISGASLKKTFTLFQYLLLILVVAFNAADFRVYEYWGYHLDAAALFLIKQPAIVMKTFAPSDFIVNLAYFSLFGGLGYFLFRQFFDWPDRKISRRKVVLPGMIFLLAILIIPIRGGVGIAPVNPASVYHSKNQFYNQAAVNETWFLIYSFTILKNETVPAQEQLQKALTFYGNVFKNEEDSHVEGRAIENPNVILIIMESFTSKFLDLEVDGKPVSPYINALKDTSLYFSQVYSSATRTDKGVVAVLSGYPSPPGKRVLAYPQKFQKLPNLLKDFRSYGYHTGFFYGGDTEFGGMDAILGISQPDEIVDINNFPENTQGAKWGVHDHFMLDTLLYRVNRMKQPFMVTALTLSNHEPYDVPVEPAFPGKIIERKFLSSGHYADQSVGEFIKKMKTSPLWENTLIVLISDHGHPYPGKTPDYAPEKYRIPVIFTGGAVKQTDEVSKVMGQHDLAATLLAQLGRDHREYQFSRNMLSKEVMNFAYYNYRQGIGMLTDTTQVIYDIETKAAPEEQYRGNLEYAELFRIYLEEDFRKK